MISLAATTYDPNGVLWLDTRPENPFDSIRRGSVTATLDGGTSVYDAGYSIADQTIRCTLTGPTRQQLETLRYLAAYYPQIIFCCEAGAFLARLEFSTSGQRLVLKLRLISRLDT